jgi:hydroxyacylglutathione hydrolase
MTVIRSRIRVVIIPIEVGPLATNCYLVKADDAEYGVVIDPGAEGVRIVEQCRRAGLTPRYIINTHGHADHIAANQTVHDAFPEAEVCIGVGDAPALPDPVANLSVLLGATLNCPAADLLLTEDQELCVGKLRLRVIETPGHTPGGICLICDDEEAPQVFCGDTVFRRDVGRTDFPGGDRDALRRSIVGKILPLPDNAVLWPGHGPRTTVGEERAENPFLV